MTARANGCRSSGTSNRSSSLARGFRSQGDVVVRCREAADRVGATPLDRPEDVAVNPLNGRIYLSCTMNTERSEDDTARAGADFGSPRAPNPSGHILELIESGGDAAATRFRWEVFVLAGDPKSGGLLSALPRTSDLPLPPDATYFGGFADATELSAFANPDNLGFDRDGNLWIVTDGGQPNGVNNGCFVCPTQGEWRGAVRQFMSGPWAPRFAVASSRPTVEHCFSRSSIPDRAVASRSHAVTGPTAVRQRPAAVSSRSTRRILRASLAD